MGNSGLLQAVVYTNTHLLSEGYKIWVLSVFFTIKGNKDTLSFELTSILLITQRYAHSNIMARGKLGGGGGGDFNLYSVISGKQEYTVFFLLITKREKSV